MFPIAREDLIRHNIYNEYDEDDDENSNENSNPKNYRNFDDEYEIHDIIGEGGFGTVYRCTHKITGIERAVKIINNNTHNIKDVKLFRNELNALLDLDSPYIVRLLEYYYDNNDNSIKLVCSLCRGPDLLDRIRDEVNQKGRFDEEYAVILLRHMLKAVAYCHKSGIVHWDIKPENFMFANPSKTATLKMIDMGLAKRHLIPTTTTTTTSRVDNNNDKNIRSREGYESITSLNHHHHHHQQHPSSSNDDEDDDDSSGGVGVIFPFIAGTLRYMPPEIVERVLLTTTTTKQNGKKKKKRKEYDNIDNRVEYNAAAADGDDDEVVVINNKKYYYNIDDPRKVDIWAIGVIFAMLLSGVPLFSLTDDEDIVMNDILDPEYVIKRISTNDEYINISDDAFDMLYNLLSFNPNDRFDASEALNHPLIIHSYERDAIQLQHNKDIRQVFNFDIINRMRYSTRLPPLARICRLLIAHQCRDREIRRLRDTFRRFDIDGDGYLDKHEIQTVCEYYNIPLPDDFDDIFNACDLQRNNRLNFVEFVAATLDDELTDIDSDSGKRFLQYVFQQLSRDNNYNNNNNNSLCDNDNTSQQQQQEDDDDDDNNEYHSSSDSLIDASKIKKFFYKSSFTDDIARLLIEGCYDKKENDDAYNNTLPSSDHHHHHKMMKKVDTLNFNQFVKCFKLLNRRHDDNDDISSLSSITTR